MKITFCFLLFMPFFESVSFAESPVPAKSSARAESISKTNWLEQFQINFSTSFCQKTKFVTDCLKMTENICTAEFKKLLSPCANQAQLTETVQLGAESEAFGAKIGRCVARGLYQKSKGPKGDSACSEKSL